MATGGKHIDIGPHESLVTTAIMAVCYKEAGAEHLLVIIEHLAVRMYLFIYTNVLLTWDFYRYNLKYSTVKNRYDRNTLQLQWLL